jgi:predicted PurR-regulated permease PerM
MRGAEAIGRAPAAGSAVIAAGRAFAPGDANATRLVPEPPTHAATSVSLPHAAISVVSLILALAAIRAGAAFFIPLAISVFLSYALSPVVASLEQWRVPRALAAGIVVLSFVAAAAATLYRTGSDAADVLELLPQAVEKVRLSLMDLQRDGAGPLHHVQETAAELEKLAVAAQPTGAAKPSVARPPAIDLGPLLIMGTGNAVLAAGQVVSVVFLTFFLLAAGALFRRKLMSIVGPSMRRRRVTLHILDEVHRLNQHYFAVLLVVNLAVGVAVGLAMHAIGLERALVWGLAAGVLHTIPYLGAAAIAAAAALAAYVQLGSAWAALGTSAFVLGIVAVLGVGLQTWLMGRAARMNAPAVFVSLLFWGMLWGAWGLLLAVPIMVAVKTVCDHIDGLRAWGAMLGQ